MSYNRPAAFDEFAYAICCSWATQIRRAMLGDAGYPGHAPPKYAQFHELNPHSISAERGNAAIDAEITRVRRAAEIEQELIEEDRAEQQRERDNDKLAIPVAALKIILDHDTTVARLHTTQIQAAVATRRGPPAPPRFWFNKRFRGGRGRGNRGVNEYRPRYHGKESNPPGRSPLADVSMRESTPVLSGHTAPPVFGANFPNFSFGEFASARGSPAFPTQSHVPEATPAPESEAGQQYDVEYEDFDMMEGDPAQASTSSVTEGMAGMALNVDQAPEQGQSTTNLQPELPLTLDVDDEDFWDGVEPDGPDNALWLLPSGKDTVPGFPGGCPDGAKVWTCAYAQGVERKERGTYKTKITKACQNTIKRVAEGLPAPGFRRVRPLAVTDVPPSDARAEPSVVPTGKAKNAAVNPVAAVKPPAAGKPTAAASSAAPTTPPAAPSAKAPLAKNKRKREADDGNDFEETFNCHSKAVRTDAITTPCHAHAAREEEMTTAPFGRVPEWLDRVPVEIEKAAVQTAFNRASIALNFGEPILPEYRKVLEDLVTLWRVTNGPFPQDLRMVLLAVAAQRAPAPA
ncbi:hypothetical protein AURDEDRAFT_129012 [Auricularia subglabra TFB-10046 SS5]|nr:hypothetical protein AURDEDRAFT_129012 [Auricularia subglabra TFB-10046 SS5]